MSDIINTLKKSAVITKSEEVLQICQPLFQQCEFNYFDYTRVYQDGSFSSLTSDPEWFLHFFEREFYISNSLVDTGIHLWNAYQSPEVIKEAQLFEHYNGITIFKKGLDYCEFYDFAAPKHNQQATSIYFNHVDLLENFFLYFKEKADALIDLSGRQKIIIPDAMIGQRLSDTADLIEEMIKIIRPTRYRFRHMEEGAYLTPREMDTLILIAKGMSAKEVARSLNLSPRTVDYYIQNAKIKLGGYNRSELVNLIRDQYPGIIK